MKKYEVDLYDYETGATSPIDTVEAEDGYTADQYIEDCQKNADEDWIRMIENGKIMLFELED